MDYTVGFRMLKLYIPHIARGVSGIGMWLRWRVNKLYIISGIFGVWVCVALQRWTIWTRGFHGCIWHVQIVYFAYPKGCVGCWKMVKMEGECSDLISNFRKFWGLNVNSSRMVRDMNKGTLRLDLACSGCVFHILQRVFQGLGYG